MLMARASRAMSLYSAIGISMRLRLGEPATVTSRGVLALTPDCNTPRMVVSTPQNTAHVITKVRRLHGRRPIRRLRTQELLGPLRTIAERFQRGLRSCRTLPLHQLQQPGLAPGIDQHSPFHVADVEQVYPVIFRLVRVALFLAITHWLFPSRLAEERPMLAFCPQRKLTEPP